MKSSDLRRCSIYETRYFKSREEVSYWLELFADEQHPQMLTINALCIAIMEPRSKIGFRRRPWGFDRFSALYKLYENKNRQS